MLYNLEPANLNGDGFSYSLKVERMVQAKVQQMSLATADMRLKIDQWLMKLESMYAQYAPLVAQKYNVSTGFALFLSILLKTWL